MDGRQKPGIEQSTGAMSDSTGRPRERPAPGFLEIFEDLAKWWGEGLAIIVILLIVTSLVARGLTMIGLLVPGLAGPVAAALILSALCVLQLAGVLVAFVRAGSGRHGAAWQIANLVLVLMSLGLYMETFAAVTTCFWRASGLHVDEWGGLWHAESFYLWHVVRSIPLLDITSTLHWREPAYGMAHTPPGLVLAFRATVILPLLQAALSGYRLAVEHRTTEDVGQRFVLDHWTDLRRSVLVSRLLGIARVVGGAVAVAAVGYGLTWLVTQALADDSAFNRWWVRTALPAMRADGSPVEHWAAAGPSIVLLIAGVFGLYHVVSAARYRASALWNWSNAGMALTMALVGLYGIVLWDAGVLVVLTRLDLGVHLPDTSGPLTVVEALVWQVAHMVPGLDITGTLHWTAPITLDGGLTSWVVLTLKLLFAVIVVFLGLPVVRTAVIRTRYGPITDAWMAIRETAGMVRAVSTSQPASQDFWQYVRARLNWVISTLAARPRFAELVPPLQALLDALPETSPGPSPPPTNAEIDAALTAFRIRVLDYFPGAATAIEPPYWLRQEAHQVR